MIRLIVVRCLTQLSNLVSFFLENLFFFRLPFCVWLRRKQKGNCFFFLITSITSPFIGSVSGGFHFCGVPNDESFYLESVPFLFSFYPI